jgi:DNA-binding transcriptional LysR family regulator
MELRQLSYFVAVADEGQITRAAARVSIAQPAISTQIRRLEAELGEALFQRDPQGVTLTAAGEALLPHARAALAAATRGRDTIASLRGLLSGRLRIGVSRPADPRLTRAVGAFHRAHPAIEITLSEQHNEPLLEAVAAGELDAAVVGVGAQAIPPQIQTRVIATEPLALGVSRMHPLARRGSVTLAALRDEPMITLQRGSGLRTVLEGACRDAGFAPRIAVEAGELTSVVELAAEGLGVAIVPRSALEGTDVAVLRITRPRLQRRTALAWHRAGTSPAGRAFLELAGAHYEAAAHAATGGRRP